MAEEKKLSGPDFAAGVSITEFAADGVQGHANGEAILVARRGDAYFAIGALYPLWRSIGRRPFSRRYRPMPMASRLFQSSHRRGAPRAGP